MKRFFSRDAVIIFCVALFMFGWIWLSGSIFGKTSRSTMEREAKEEAMEERYREGVSEAQEHIASLVEVEMWDVEFDVEDKYGILPEDAIRILEDYADGEPISKRELNNAIRAVSEYYSQSQDVINRIDDYWID